MSYRAILLIALFIGSCQFRKHGEYLERVEHYANAQLEQGSWGFRALAQSDPEPIKRLHGLGIAPGQMRSGEGMMDLFHNFWY